MSRMAGGVSGLIFSHSTENGDLKGEFEAVLSTTIERTLRLILGDGTAEAIYSHISRDFNLERNDIASNIQTLCKVLNNVFGDGGRVIQRVIVRRLCEALNVEYGEVPMDDLPSAVLELSRLRRRFTPQ
ncbi:MAG: hypothetical protein ACUVTM_00590 [Candidatus Bathyarchaeia archaeon]